MIGGVMYCVFFFSSRRRHTRLQGDWSSDVCSSDLGQRQLAKKHAELQKVSAEKSQILGMVAHDLRNPLSGILNATEYVLDDAATLLEIGRASCRERV